MSNSVHLPNLVNYMEGLPALPPNTHQIPVACSPANGSSFTPSMDIYFDLLNRGSLVPDSMYLSYTYTVQQITTNDTSDIKGCPVDIMNMLTNITLDVAQKYKSQTLKTLLYIGFIRPLAQKARGRCTMVI